MDLNILHPLRSMLDLSIAHYAFLRLRRILHRTLLLQSYLYPINDFYEICHFIIIIPRSCNGEAELPFKIIVQAIRKCWSVVLALNISTTSATVLLNHCLDFITVFHMEIQGSIRGLQALSVKKKSKSRYRNIEPCCSVTEHLLQLGARLKREPELLSAIGERQV